MLSAERRATYSLSHQQVSSQSVDDCGAFGALSDQHDITIDSDMDSDADDMEIEDPINLDQENSASHRLMQPNEVTGLHYLPGKDNRATLAPPHGLSLQFSEKCREKGFSFSVYLQRLDTSTSHGLGVALVSGGRKDGFVRWVLLLQSMMEKAIRRQLHNCIHSAHFSSAGSRAISF